MKFALRCLTLGVVVVLFARSLQAGTFKSEFIELRKMVGRAEYDASFDRCKAMIVQHPTEGILYDVLAEIAMYAGRTDDAMSFLWERVEDGTGLSLCYFGLGNLSYRREDDHNAIMFLSKAIELGVEVPECYSDFVYSYERSDGVDPTLKLMTSLCHRHPKNGHFWYGLALAYWANGDFSNVVKHLSEALRIRPAEARFRHARSTALMVIAKEISTGESKERLIEEALSQNDFHGLLLLRSGIAIALQQQGKIDAAIDECLGLIRIAEEFGYVRWIGWGYKQLSDIYSILSQYGRSVESAEKAFLNACLSKDYQLIHSALARSFDSNLELLNFDAATTCIARRIRAYSASKSRTYLVGTLLDASRLFVFLSQPEVSLELVIGALDLSERTALDRRLYWEIHTTLGNTYEALGDNQSALRHYEITESITPAEPFYSRVQAITQGNLGSIYLRMSRNDLALERFRQQLAFAHEARYVREIAYGHLNQGRALLAAGKTALARSEILKAIDGSERDSIPTCQMLALRSLANLCLSTGDTICAERALRQRDSILCLSKVHTSSLMSTWSTREQSENDFELPELLCAIGSFEQGFIGSEAHRVALQPQWKVNWPAIKRARQVDPALLDLVQTTTQLRAAVDSLTRRPEMQGGLVAMPEDCLFIFPQAATLDIQRQIALGSLGKEASLSAIVSNRNVVSDLRQVQQKLSPDEAVLSFIISGEHSFACLTKNDTIAFVGTLPGRDSIHSLLKRLGHITDPSESQALILPPVLENGELALCARLYECILGPFETELSNCSKIFIVPPPGLPPIPFDLMVIPPGRANSTSDDAGGLFVAERFELCYIPDYTSILWKTEDEGRADLDWLGFGNPDLPLQRSARVDPELLFLREKFGVTDRSRLESIPDEINGIKNGFGHSGAAYIGANATRSRLLSLSGAADVVHIAAHGYFHDRIPWASGLLLSGDALKGQQAILSAFDIFEYPLARRLLVLSGCRSLKACGFWSPRVGLRVPYHGSVAVIGSWSIVDDRSTADLMLRFYARTFATV